MKNLFLIFFLCLSFIAQAQKSLFPSWKTGDTLSYFISESALVETERISLESYSIQLILKEHNSASCQFNLYLLLSESSKKGEHWQKFFSQLQYIPFTYVLKYGEEINFQEPKNLPQILEGIDRILLNLADKENLQPFDYNDLTQWMNQLRPKGELPLVFAKYFDPLNKVFSPFGKAKANSKKSSVQEIITDCNDSSYQLNFNANRTLQKKGIDTLLLSKEIILDSLDAKNKIQPLADCGKLEGLDVIVKIDGYSLIQQEAWQIQKGKVHRYTYDRIITMHFQELTSSLTSLIRVVLFE